MGFDGKPVMPLRSAIAHVGGHGIKVHAELRIYRSGFRTDKFRSARRQWHGRRRDLAHTAMLRTWQQLFSRAWCSQIEGGDEDYLFDDPAGRALGRSLQVSWYACCLG